MIVKVDVLKKKLEEIKAMEFPEGDLSRESRDPDCEGCGVWLNGWMQGLEDAVEFIERLILEEAV